jgi:FSR family fosmidomycin resistance protein-like MFS transporter
MGLLYLLIEFFDELTYGMQNALLPALRTELLLTYAQIGLLLGLPKIINIFLEPFLLLLGDTRLRKGLMVGGGLVITACLLLTAGAQQFPPLLAAFILFFPASGAFVSLSQATLMDLNPGREAKMMARWTLSGSIANLVGPLIVAAGFALGLGWRLNYVSLAVIGLGLTIILIISPFPRLKLVADSKTFHSEMRQVIPNLLQALKNRSLLRWILLLEFSDLLLDVFLGYSALYFADVMQLTPAQVGLAIGALTAGSLLSDILVVPLLERIPGKLLVRISAAFTLLIYPAFLLAPWSWAKIVLAIMTRFSTMGWYAVMQGEAYAALPGRSGTVGAINSAAGLFGGFIAWMIGAVAAQAGLPIAMWLLLAGPLALVLFVD